MVVIQFLGKPMWVKKTRCLADYFLHNIEGKSDNFIEVHVVFDQHYIDNSLKEQTFKACHGGHRDIACYIHNGALIEKLTLQEP